jgi:hypothetical protein
MRRHSSVSSDEVLCARWMESRCYQYFRGELRFCDFVRHAKPPYGSPLGGRNPLGTATGRGAALAAGLRASWRIGAGG